MSEQHDDIDNFILEIKKHADCLSRLMDKPEPGLNSWLGLVQEHAQWLSDWWSGKLCQKYYDQRTKETPKQS